MSSLKRARTTDTVMSTGTVRTQKSSTTKRKDMKSLVQKNPKVNWGFPKKLYIVHKYVDTFNINSVAGSSVNYQFRCNGMFDPNATGTGSQPTFFDNCAAIYDHFTVVKSTIVISVANNGSFSSPHEVCLYIDDDTSPVATIQQAMLQPGAVAKLLPSPGIQGPILLSKTWSARAFFGGDPLANDNLQGTSSADPTEQSLYTITAAATNGATQSITVQATIYYYAIWDELKTQPIN